MIDIPCILFAGGKSSRMGENKALLPFAGFSTLTEYQYSRLSQIFSKVYISCKDKSIFSFHANFIEDTKTFSMFAPTLGFVTVFERLDTKKIFALSVDTPFITQKEIDKIMLADTSHLDAVIAKTAEGIHPLCGIYYRSLQSKFLHMLCENNHKLTSLLRKEKTTYVNFLDSKPFLNMNHREDYEKALQLINSTLL